MMRIASSTRLMRSLPFFRLYLQHIAFTSNHLVQHGIDKEAYEQTRDKTSHNNDSERPLSIRSNACGKRSWQQSKAGNESRHHNRTKSQERSLPCIRTYIFPLQSQLVDVRDENDGRLDRNPEQS